MTFNLTMAHDPLLSRKEDKKKSNRDGGQFLKFILFKRGILFMVVGITVN